MAEISMKRLEGEPIIHVTLKGHLTIEEVTEVYRRTDEMRKDMPKHIYRIADVSEVSTSFTEMMQILKQATSHSGSTSSDYSITIVFVGTNHWAKLFTDAMRQGAFGGREIPIFESVDAAITYVRAEIAAKAV
jgi:hypothetical protein